MPKFAAHVANSQAAPKQQGLSRQLSPSLAHEEALPPAALPVVDAPPNAPEPLEGSVPHSHGPQLAGSPAQACAPTHA